MGDRCPVLVDARTVLLLSLLLAAGCVDYPINAPWERYDRRFGYRNLDSTDQTESLPPATSHAHSRFDTI